jgi:MFS family permease
MPATPSASNPSSRYAWYVVAVLTLANVSANIDRGIMGFLVGPLQQDFQINDTQASYIGALAFSLFYAVLGIPIARWADRWNRRNIMGAGVATWSLFTALCATARSFGRLFVFRVGVGVGEASLQAPSVSLLADYFPRERLSRAMSVYSLGNFLGSGLAYLVGGLITQWALTAAAPTLPFFGTIRPWQAVFVYVGLPGLLVAALFLTVREPPRRNVDQAGRYLPLSALFKYVFANKMTYLTHGVGFAMSASVNFAFALWIPQFFIRTFQWDVAKSGKVQGILTMTLGVVGVLMGGRIADWFVARGKVDGPLRVGIIASIGMLVFGSLFPLMPTPGLAVAALAVVNIFAALPWGAANAAAAEIAPTPLRAQGAALYFFLLSLISGTLGPTALALFTDKIFGKENIRYSFVAIDVIGMTLAIVLFSAGLAAYRRTLDYRDRWEG